MLRLINQTLDFRKFENGKLELHLSSFNLAKSLKEWTEAFRTLSHRKHIRFKVDVEEEELEELYAMVADPEMMERITYNLLSNAFKFTADNGEISVYLSAFRQNQESWIRLKFTDTGIGMPKEQLAHIFESFYQVDTHDSGSGIGLALVKAFVEMHHGKIHVDSEERKGTVFTIEIPLVQRGELNPLEKRENLLENLKEGAVLAADQSEVHVLQKEESLADKEKATVLIIEDNADVRQYIRLLLSKEYNILEAANGKEGVQQAVKYVPDVIICDVMMPVMDGMECCRILKSELQTSHIPVLMLTAYTLEEQKIKGYECGADSYISKPFTAKLLKVRLQNLLENHRRIQNFFADKVSVQKDEVLNQVDQGFIGKLRQLIDEQLGNSELSVEDLGASLGLGRVQLYRKTKALTGYSPNELLRIARLKKAASLLASSGKTISEITYEVGFTSPSYFTKCYKDYFGESPTDFLKRK